MTENWAALFFLWKPFNALAEAVRFLTILPVPGTPAGEVAIARSTAVFPLVGLLLGGLGVAAGWLAEVLWGHPVHAIAVVICSAVLTAGLHLDGVADSCDGLFSWRPRPRKLEIMKDSRIGTMEALGRVYGIFWFPVAAADGLAHTFRQQVRRFHFVLATLFGLGAGLAILFPWGGALLLIVGPAVHLSARAMARALGGLTGDTYGALCELGEVLTLLLLAAFYRHQLLPHISFWETLAWLKLPW